MDDVITPEWVAIELHFEKKGEGISMVQLGTVPSLADIGQWFEGTARLGGLQDPKWTDELRLVAQPEGKVLHTYRLGWVEVEPKPLPIIKLVTH